MFNNVLIDYLLLYEMCANGLNEY